MSDDDLSFDDVVSEGQRICPYCNEPMVYVGVDDGGGPYGDSVCEIWDCQYCDYSEEGDCI